MYGTSGNVKFSFPSSPDHDVPLDFISGNIRTLGKTELTVSLGTMSLFLSKTWRIKQRQRTAQVGVNGGALPCVRLACATSSYCVTNEPRLSPQGQHYELNAKQHVLDRTRVSVCRRYSKATRSTSLGEVAAQT